MTTHNNMQIVINACIKANPSIVKNKQAQLIKFDGTVEYFEEHKLITLADVLLAMPLEMELHHEPTMLLLRKNYGIEKEPTDWIWWNLFEPLVQQKPEVITMLANLLK